MAEDWYNPELTKLHITIIKKHPHTPLDPQDCGTNYDALRFSVLYTAAKFCAIYQFSIVDVSL